MCGASRLAAVCFVAVALLSCSPDLRPPLDGFHLLVFPAEAELGGSATAIISSNYIPLNDAVEDYALDRSRVAVLIRDGQDVEWPATVRAVFPLAASATSRLAQTRPGAWATVVLFDLPTDANFQLGSGPFSRAKVIVEIDGEPQLDDRAIGSIRITGRGGAGIGGQPTTLYWPPLADFELDAVVMRFVPVRDQDQQPGGGFPQAPSGTVIGGIEADLVYFTPCFTDAEAYTGSEAANAGIYLGPETLNGFVATRRLVITYPQGFTLLPPAGGTEDALGEGPLIDVAFDRPNQSVFNCSEMTPPPVWLWNVYVVRPDGQPIVDQRGAGGSFGQTSDLFARIPIPTL